MSNYNGLEHLAVTSQTADTSSGMLQNMQRCLRDLVALSALPSLWIELEPTEISECLADVLVNLLHADLVYVRLRAPDACEVCEAARAGGRSKGSCNAIAIGAALAPWLGETPPASPIVIPDPIGIGRLCLYNFPIAHDGANGTACVCSSQDGFPSAMDRLLARVACNHAASAVWKRAAFPHPAPRIADK